MFTKTLVGVVAALLCAPAANAKPTQVHWYHWNSHSRAVSDGERRFGSHAIVGLTSMTDLAALRRDYGLEQVHAIPQLKAARVTVSRTRLHRLLARAPRDARVRYVSPPGPTRRPLAMPNDPLLTAIDPTTSLPYEWQFGAAHVDQALQYTHGSPDVVVGTIDTGLADTPDLAGKVDGRWNISLDGTLTPTATAEGNDDMGHGTAVASLIAANTGDGFGMAGFGGDSHVIAVRVDDHGFSEAALAVALTKLDSLGVQIINMSLGGTQPDGPLLLDAIHKVAADGVLLVAASGNSHSFVGYPAADLQPAGGGRGYGLAVGASDMDGNPALFTNFGRHLSLLAPGNYTGGCSGVLVAVPQVSEFDESCYPLWAGAGGARYGYLAGTSFAAPEVAGIAALIWAARPWLTNWQVADIIKQSAQRAPGSGWTADRGCGVLDAGAALALATSSVVPAVSGTGSSCTTGGSQPPTWPDRNPPPTVQAIPEVGGWNQSLSLRFKTDEDTHEIKPAITVTRNGRTITRLTNPFFTVRPFENYGLLWHSPKVASRAAYGFCVTLTDRRGRKSAPSCAPISLR